MLSYTVHALLISFFARESIDLLGPLPQAQRREEAGEGAKMRNDLNKKYENFVTGLPTYFRLGSTVGLTSTGPLAAIPVQRWMLHQQLWSLFLRLHRGSLSSQDGHASCQLLAQNIISTQAQIQARCTVCGSLSTSESQLFSAALVLLVDLLFSSMHKDADSSSAHLSRLVTREKIREAIELLRTQSDAEGSPFPQDPQPERVKASAQRSVIALEALMKLEEEESSNNESFDAANWTGNRLGGQEVKSNKTARKSLKNKVMDTLETLRANTTNATAAMKQAGLNSFSALDMSMLLPTATDGLQDLDVLPVLSNDPTYDLWQFLDFDPPTQSPTENSSSATADLQTRVGSIDFMLSSDMTQTHSLSTPDSAEVYNNTEGTHVSHRSPSSP